MKEVTKNTLLLEAETEIKSSQGFFTFMIFVTLFWIIAWGVPSIIFLFFSYVSWTFIPLITVGGIGVAITILAHKGLSKSNAACKSVEEGNFYIKAMQITALREDEDSEGVHSYYICFPDGEEICVSFYTPGRSNQRYNGFVVGDTVYVVYISESNKRLCFYNAKKYELGSDIADKLIKTE